MVAVLLFALATVGTLLWGNLQRSHHDGPLNLGVSLNQTDTVVDAVSYPSNPDNTPSLLQPSMVAETTPETPATVPEPTPEATPVAAAPVTEAPTLENVTERLQTASHSVAQYVSASYRISLKRAKQLTNMAIEIGEAKNVDPLLIMAVVATESSYNPNARSSAGAEGLMQVVTSIHRAKYDAFGGEDKAFDPYANMSVGTDILNELIQRTGNVRKALKWYSGAANLSSDNGYSARVLAERHRLAIAASGNTQSAIELSSRGTTPEATDVKTTPTSTTNPTLAFDDWLDIAKKDMS